jgi:glutaredoxin
VKWILINLEKTNFEIYGKDNCQYCTAAKTLLDLRGYPYKYFDVIKDEEARANFQEYFPTARTVPQILAEEKSEAGWYWKIVGGYEDLIKYLN